MGLNVNEIKNANIYSTYRVRNSPEDRTNYAASPRFCAEKTDKSNDSQFSTSEALKNFGKGLVSPITSMFSSPKNFLMSLGMIAGSVGLIAATGGAAAPLFVAAGVGIGALQAGATVLEFAKAKNGDDLEKAFYEAGTATSTLGLSLFGAKASLKEANIETEGLNIFNSAKKCFTSFKNLSSECFDVFKSGHYRANLSKFFKNFSEPKIFRKYSHEAYEEGSQKFQSSLDALSNALPEKFRPYLKGRNKSEVSIYSKMIKEATVTIEEKIKQVQNDANLTPEMKKNFIAKIKESKAKMVKDYEFAKSKIGDLYGAKIILDDARPANMEELVSGLIKSSKSNKIKILEIENYRGTNPIYKNENNFYFTEKQVKRLTDVSENLEVNNSFKKSGYTAVHLKVQPKGGQIIELQIRGKNVDDVYNWEHFLYDFRQDKDLSCGSNQRGVILSPARKAIKSLTEDQLLKYRKYIYDNYIYAQQKDLGMKSLQPKLPDGINSILSSENLTKIYNETRDISPSGIKNPFILYPQLILVDGGNDLIS